MMILKRVERRYLNNNILLSSTKSYRIALESVRQNIAGLNKHRQSLLSRVPHTNDWAKFKVNSITTKDLAFLSAASSDEFALLRGKHEDILFHGSRYHCEMDDVLIDLLIQNKISLIAHTHVDCGILMPSKDDRIFLQTINQKDSILVSAVDGKEVTFSAGLFD